MASGPLRTWIVTRSDDGTAPTTYIVYAWNGELLDSANDQPFVGVGEPTEDHLTTCALELFDGWRCECGRPPPPPAGTKGAKGWKEPWEVAGPARCDRTEQPGALRTGIGAFMAMITVGLVIDMGDASHTIVLVHSTRGEP